MRRSGPAFGIVMIAMIYGIGACERAPSPPAARPPYPVDDFKTPLSERRNESSRSASPLARSQTPQATDSMQAQRGNTPEGAQFAEWVISTDPEAKFIRDAFVRDEQVLRVIFDDGVARSEVEMRIGSLLSDMRRTFQDRPLEVIAYRQSGEEVARMGWGPDSGRAARLWR